MPWRFVGVALVLGCAIYLFFIGRTEAFTEKVRAGTATWWPYGESSLEGWVRASPTGGLGFGFLLSAVLVGDPAQEVGSFDNVVGVVFLALFALSMSLVATIVVFNRPAFLGPPHMHAQSGAWADWTRRKGRD